jgi:hypothetical protein
LVCPAVAFSDLIIVCFLRGRVLRPHPTPNLEDQASVCMSPRDRVAQLYPLALGFPFSCLLWHARIWWSSSSPPHRNLFFLENQNFLFSVNNIFVL